MPRPSSASMKEMTIWPMLAGRSKPRVNSDEPLMARASESGLIPVPQKIPV